MNDKPNSVNRALEVLTWPLRPRSAQEWRGLRRAVRRISASLNQIPESALRSPKPVPTFPRPHLGVTKHLFQHFVLNGQFTNPVDQDSDVLLHGISHSGADSNSLQRAWQTWDLQAWKWPLSWYPRPSSNPSQEQDILSRMLKVIFGAGASYDSAPAFRPGFRPSVDDGPWRPPLAADLFRDPNHAFGHIVERYPRLSQILPYLREPSDGRSVEEELEFLHAQAGDYMERLRQFASVRYYLRNVLFEASDRWRDKTSGVTNYAPLIDEILRLDKSGDLICLVTFNYDLLLDRALASYGFDPQDLGRDYFAHVRLRLFKPHGSVNWARFVNINPDARLRPQQLIEEADNLQLTDEFVRVYGIEPADSFPRGRTVWPVIAIPFQNKTQHTFEWPLSHQEQFLQLLPRVTKILIIGWQAREAHFMVILRSHLRRLTHRMVVGKDAKDSEQTLQNFAIEIGKASPPDNWSVGKGGFTQFVVNREGDEFFKA